MYHLVNAVVSQAYLERQDLFMTHDSTGSFGPGRSTKSVLLVFQARTKLSDYLAGQGILFADPPGYRYFRVKSFY